ncbi:MAG TPA: hypothetical protein VFE91_02860 [Nitrososphaerales archaeon]|nr:hypothetical protein [Nitrososphaerales archaeon]
MKLVEVLGLLFGVAGIVVGDIGFAGSGITDLFYIPSAIKNSVPPNIGSGLLGNLMPGGNTTLFFIGAGLLAIGMVLLIDYNHNRVKISIAAVTPK